MFKVGDVVIQIQKSSVGEYYNMGDEPLTIMKIGDNYDLVFVEKPSHAGVQSHRFALYKDGEE